MVNESEVITLLVATGGVFFVLLNLRALTRSIPSWRWLLTAFLFLYAGWFLTVFESLVLPQVLNVLEHATYMLSSLLMMAWAIKTLVGAREERS